MRNHTMFNGQGFFAQNTAATHRGLAIHGKYLQCMGFEAIFFQCFIIVMFCHF